MDNQDKKQQNDHRQAITDKIAQLSPEKKALLLQKLKQQQSQKSAQDMGIRECLTYSTITPHPPR